VVLVDTNVLIDAFEDDPTWADWSIAQMRAQSRIHELAINPVIYAELSMAFTSHEVLDEVVDAMRLRMLDLPRASLFLAGKAFVKYRRNGGPRPSVLPDFMIGAHAAVAGMSILTRDVRRYRNFFPGVKLVTPP
jgi:predicted nucleic acid-binding protein